LNADLFTHADQGQIYRTYKSFYGRLVIRRHNINQLIALFESLADTGLYGLIDVSVLRGSYIVQPVADFVVGKFAFQLGNLGFRIELARLCGIHLTPRFGNLIGIFRLNSFDLYHGIDYFIPAGK